MAAIILGETIQSWEIIAILIVMVGVAIPYVSQIGRPARPVV